MKRVKDTNGNVHFAGFGRIGLCGFQETNLLGEVQDLKETSEQVNCIHCATLYTKVKNAPWNEVDAFTLGRSVFMAAESHHCGSCTVWDCPKCGTDEITKCGRFVDDGRCV